ncbi:hypothetical protein [Arthrospiribacter ruber]|uniref:Lipoprotein n=1 Tax=Arthrospiribacter ruber TaxID=2487934 RepID=A0A951ISJ1_9BACT|nr:hypothetical protein [Arthrospiribacter ruber]MBW3466648.1 hypothetical protein [Arthrospiribacter ruber]
MKTYLHYFLISCFLLLLSCSEDSAFSDMDYHLKMKINGVERAYETGTMQLTNVRDGGTTYYQLNIIGLDDTFGRIDVTVNDAKPIAAGVFNSENLNPAADTPMAGLMVNEEGGFTNVYANYFGTGFPNHGAVVNIPEYNQTFVAGTFSGKISLRGNDEVLTISEGTFKVRRPN